MLPVRFFYTKFNSIFGLNRLNICRIWNDKKNAQNNRYDTNLSPTLKTTKLNSPIVIVDWIVAFLKIKWNFSSNTKVSHFGQKTNGGVALFSSILFCSILVFWNNKLSRLYAIKIQNREFAILAIKHV